MTIKITKIEQIIVIKNKNYVINQPVLKLINVLNHILLPNINREILWHMNHNHYQWHMIKFNKYVNKGICLKWLLKTHLIIIKALAKIKMLFLEMKKE